MIGIAALLLAAAAAPPAGPPAGLYETHQMEMAGALELQPKGRFRYRFDYGAVSEASAGRWRVVDGAVRLTSDSRPKDADPERSWAAFESQRFAFDRATLVIRRYDTVIRFRRVRP